MFHHQQGGLAYRLFNSVSSPAKVIKCQNGSNDDHMWWKVCEMMQL